MAEIASENKNWILMVALVALVLGSLVMSWPKLESRFQNLPSNYSLPQTTARDVGTVRYTVATGEVKYYDGFEFVAFPSEGIAVKGAKLSSPMVRIGFDQALYASREIVSLTFSTGNTAIIDNKLATQTETDERIRFRFWSTQISDETILAQAGDVLVDYRPAGGSSDVFLVRFPATVLYCKDRKECGRVPASLQKDAEQITQAVLAWRRASYVHPISFGGGITGCVREEGGTLVARLGMNQERC